MNHIISTLLGKWFIIKKTSNSAVISEGTAIFKHENKNKLHYKEEVVTNIDKKIPIKGFREYIYQYDKEKAVIYFADNNIFYQLIPKEISDKNFLYYAIGKYLCKNDVYVMEYFFTNKDSFTIECSVSGPEKNYKISNYYKRQS